MAEIRIGIGGLLGFLALLLSACGDDGHVVGDMASGGSDAASNDSGTGTSDGSSSTSGATNAGTSTGSNGAATSGSDGSSSSTTGSSGGTDGGSGGIDTGSGGSAGNPTSGSGGTLSIGGNGGTAGNDGSGGSASGGTAGAGGTCPAGQMWCPSCYQGEGSCGVACTGSQCIDCSYEKTEERCAARYDCHPVYADPGTCGCAGPGCCTHYSFCAPGATADCGGENLACATQSPFCDSPSFVLSYANACFEGCVKPEECSGANVCPCPDCADGEQMCLQDADCVLASGPVGNGTCRNSDGTCGTCKCTSPDTPIATLSGNRKIHDLRVGDYVYSVNHDSIELVPIKRINRIPVVNHHVLRVEFESGAKFEISATHPTASGRPLSAFGVGDELMGERILRVTRIPYRHAHTYDILPDSDTGTYFADGVLVGSTLFAGQDSQRTECSR